MATTLHQRIGIWVIAAILVAGTIGSFVVIIIGNNNSASDQANLNELQTQYQAATQKQADQLSAKYYTQFNAYQSQVAAFDKASVSSEKSTDLLVGTGDTITASSSYSAYYIGWNPSGKVFDSSIDSGALKEPLAVTPGGVIPGWSDETVGMKIGGVRLLEIPSDKAYGSTGQGADIPPNTPLKFVVMVIPTPPAIPIPAALEQYYEQQYGS